jgi:sodium-dependent phosphate cotransporter
VFDRGSRDWLVALAALGVILLFLFAVQLLGTATDAAAPALRAFFRRFVVGDAGAIGLSWLGSYVLANGSVVAALALSLFTADVIAPTQLFVMVAGSRLGGAAIVVFIGALDYFQKRRFDLQESVSMGLLTFLLTHSIYLPATVVGYLFLPAIVDSTGTAAPAFTLGFRPFGFVEPVTRWLTATIGSLGAVIVAVAILFGSLQLFDRLLASVETEAIRQRFFSHLQRTWVSFAVGLLVTVLTTSVAFSLGVIVPLYNREYVTREELIPYILGANIGTLFDTLVVAVVLESAVGTAVVLEVMGLATLFTLLALLVHGRYTALVLRADDALLEDRRLFVAFVVSLAVLPVLLLLVPLAMAG